jgi:hypothetical protein
MGLLDRLEMPALDLLPGLRARAQLDPDLYHRSPAGHFSPSGHAGVASALAAHLVNSVPETRGAE